MSDRVVELRRRPGDPAAPRARAGPARPGLAARASASRRWRSPIGARGSARCSARPTRTCAIAARRPRHPPHRLLPGWGDPAVLDGADEPAARDRTHGRLRGHRNVGREGRPRGREGGPGAGRVDRRRRRVHPRAASPASGLVDRDAAYLHVTTNETIEGVRVAATCRTSRRPCPSSPTCRRTSCRVRSTSSRFGLLYAGAQKNVGPAGARHRDRARGPARSRAGRPADDARLPHVRRARLPLQHPARVRDLRGDARDPMAPRRGRGARRAGAPQPREGGAASTRRSTRATASTAGTRTRRHAR